jgi:hypothetical protein
MRQDSGLSKADLVEYRTRLATRSDEMVRLPAVASGRSDENIVEARLRRYIMQCEFRRSGGARRRWDARPRYRRLAAAPGDAIG